jgi:hypothetical protein
MVVSLSNDVSGKVTWQQFCNREPKYKLRITDEKKTPKRTSTLLSIDDVEVTIGCQRDDIFTSRIPRDPAGDVSKTRHLPLDLPLLDVVADHSSIH